MAKKVFSDQFRKKIGIFIAGILIAASLAHHTVSIWDKKAFWILLVLLIASPFTIWILSLIYPRFKIAFRQMKDKQVLFILSAIVLSLLVTWVLFQAPVSYQTLTITPRASEHKQVDLLEIKVGGNVLSVAENAVESGWIVANEVITATQDSRPMSFTFPIQVNAKVDILFNSSPESGDLSLSIGQTKKEVNLSSPTQQQKLISMSSYYRMIPSWLFIPFLVISDSITFFLLFFGLFILQERGQRYFVEDPHEKFLSKRASLLILLILACLLHLFSALAVPLIVDSDSPSYLRGAVHLLQYGNFDGVFMTRGPATTLLFAPIFYLFGRNPWGMKILLHLIAIACVFISYRLGWQLSKKRWIAFCAGFLTMLLPDLYYYSNFIMSDLPNIFLVILFSSLLLDALEDFRFSRILFALSVGSFASLLRSENILMLAIGTFFLGIEPIWSWLKGVFRKKKNKKNQQNLRSLGLLLLALFLALIPIVWWSAHNLRLHGYFGLSNYSGVVLYDGWMYYAEASDMEIRNETSPAIKVIDVSTEKYPINITDSSGVATGWEIYPSLIKAGYSSQEAFQILQQATLDSILSHKELIPDILKRKWRDSFRPEISHVKTFPLPGEAYQVKKIYTEYFNSTTVVIPQIIIIQRTLFDIFHRYLSEIYRILVLLSLAAVIFSLLRKPFIKYAMLAFITLTRISISNLISLSMWRYTIAGIVLLVVFGATSAAVLFYGFKDLLFQSKK